MQDFAIAILIVAGVLVLLGVGYLVGRLQERRRTEQMRQAAEELGFEFLGQEDGGLSAVLGGFKLLSQGRGHKLSNLMRATGGEVGVAIFDYRYTVGSGKNSRTYKQTVFSFHSESLDLPSFALRPERWYHKIGKVFGYHDIDFADFPEFSWKYLLQGDSEQGIRHIFTAEVLECAESLDGISAEGGCQRLLVFRSGKRSKPYELKQSLEEGFQLYSALARACSPEVPAA